MKHTFGFAVVLMVLLSAGGFAFAQVEPTKVLVGMWEGQAQVSGRGDRTLIINSMKQTGNGEWVARGRFGYPDMISKEGGGQQMDVLLKDNDVHIEFVSPQGKFPVRLKLVGDNKLEGTVGTFERNRAVDRKITLEKVAPKAGEVK